MMINSYENGQSPKNSKTPQRWVTVCLGSLGIFNALSMRVCLSMAITEMTSAPNSTFMDEPNNSYIINNNNFSNTQLKSSNHLNPVRYDWTERTQGLILSSFYWGYMITNILGGAIVKKFGTKHTLGLGVLLTSLFTLLTPYCITWGGSTALIILRVAMGFGEGTTYPAVIDLLAHWIPEDERAKAGAVVFSGSPLGSVFGILMSGIILQHSTSGWPVVFYFHGSVGIASFLLIAAFCYSRPSENPYITKEELTYLKNKLTKVQTNARATPWRWILTSPAVWGSFVAKFGNTWGYITIVSDMPKYMSGVLKLSVLKNGYLSSIPQLAHGICAFLASGISDKVIAEKKLSVTTVRKIGCTVALFGPAIFLVVASYAGSNGLLVVALQTVGVGFMGCIFCSVMINALDLSPNYASSIMGLGNGIAVISGSLSPYIVGVLAPNQTIEEWRLVFWIVGIIAVSSGIVFLIYGSGKLQEWNDPAFLDKKTNSNIDNVEPCVEIFPLKGAE